MSWFKVDDKFHAHPKVKRIPKRVRRAAVGLWTITGAWSADYQTDGAVPEYMLDEFDAEPEEVDALVAVGLWDRAEDGIAFRGWEEFQPTRAEQDAKRAATAERVRKHRQQKAAQRNGVTSRYSSVSNAEGDVSGAHATPENTTGSEVDTPENHREVSATSGKGNAVTGALVTPVYAPPEPEPEPEPTTTPLPPEGELLATPEPPASRATASVYPDAFETFWAAWPKRRTDSAGKKPAHAAWDRAVHGTSKRKARITAQDLQAAVEAYAADPNLPPETYQPNAQTWLNQDRWENGPLPPRDGPRKDNRPDAMSQGLDTVARLRAQREARQAHQTYPQLNARTA
ncbi:MAG: hypothetical protein L0G94_14055 [Brachybacterium sp.]|uniref:hypothetical protein n=1 Tax=Brachybacterium sp. TaxID=1891286 RepID=UPI0026472F56|nr:hypothetical protein [Brachybacterium sp.]MDN5687776.1 hypothetical protein [Brachybacterium sp.]